MSINNKKLFTERHRLGVNFSVEIDEHLESVQSPFQKIDIYSTQAFGHLMAIDGFVMLTSADNFLYHEMMSHPALFSHSSPQNVAIIGGGDCGTLKEVLKHDAVQTVVQIDIDKEVTRLSEQYFPELCTSNDDPRATLLFDDGIEWIKNRPDNSLDVLIVDSTDPIGPAEGLFGVEFYRHCQRALKNDGILVHQSESPIWDGALLKSMVDAMLEAGFKVSKTLTYPQPCYPSGWWSATLASTQNDLGGSRINQFSTERFQTRYFNKEVFSACFAQNEVLRTLFN